MLLIIKFKGPFTFNEITSNHRKFNGEILKYIFDRFNPY